MGLTRERLLDAAEACFEHRAAERVTLGQVAGSLSGGEQQMLSLARALVTGPRVVLADELSVGLAPVVVDEIFAALAELRGDVSLLVVEQYVDRLLDFGGVIALDEFSLAAPPGRITGLIGPNGAGKTTMFNVCSGFQRPDRGSVFLDGVEITSESPSARARRGIARTFQQLSLFGSMTVRENVALAVESRQVSGAPLSQLGLIGRRRRAEVEDEAGELLTLTGLSAVADRPAHALSTGQARVVELARALARRPRILLLDEPASGLDVAESQAFGELLAGLVAQWGIGALPVEHDMTLALSVCDWIHVLDFGRPLFDGPPASVAASAEVRAAYLGTLEISA